jgi:hypothetical protein
MKNGPNRSSGPTPKSDRKKGKMRNELGKGEKEKKIKTEGQIPKNGYQEESSKRKGPKGTTGRTECSVECNCGKENEKML